METIKAEIAKAIQDVKKSRNEQKITFNFEDHKSYDKSKLEEALYRRDSFAVLDSMFYAIDSLSPPAQPGKRQSLYKSSIQISNVSKKNAIGSNNKIDLIIKPNTKMRVLQY